MLLISRGNTYRPGRAAALALAERVPDLPRVILEAAQAATDLTRRRVPVDRVENETDPDRQPRWPRYVLTGAKRD